MSGRVIDRAVVKAMREAGKTYREIAEHLGCEVSTVSNIASKIGITVRRVVAHKPVQIVARRPAPVEPEPDVAPPPRITLPRLRFLEARP